MLIRIVKMTFKPEKVNDFLTEFDKRKNKIANFTGCKGVDLLLDMNNPNTYFTYSKWDNEEHLENYRNSDLFNDTWNIVKKWFGDKPEAWSVKVVQ